MQEPKTPLMIATVVTLVIVLGIIVALLYNSLRRESESRARMLGINMSYIAQTDITSL